MKNVIQNVNFKSRIERRLNSLWSRNQEDRRGWFPLLVLTVFCFLRKSVLSSWSAEVPCSSVVRFCSTYGKLFPRRWQESYFIANEKLMKELLLRDWSTALLRSSESPSPNGWEGAEITEVGSWSLKFARNIRWLDIGCHLGFVDALLNKVLWEFLANFSVGVLRA